MALHDYFQGEANQPKRDLFEATFQAWYERTRAELQLIADDPKTATFHGHDRTIKLAIALKKLETTEELKDPLEAIVRVREDVSNKIAKSQSEIEHYYGRNNGYIASNTNLMLNGLSVKDQAALYNHFNLVGQLAVDDPKIISLTREIAKRNALVEVKSPEDDEVQPENREAAIG